MRKPRINRRTRVRTEHCHTLSRCTRAQGRYKLKNLNAEKACVFGEVGKAKDNPASEAEEDHAAETKDSAKVLLERRRPEMVLGHGLAAEVVTARTNVCRKALSAFCNSLAARVQGWRKYCGQTEVDRCCPRHGARLRSVSAQPQAGSTLQSAQQGFGLLG